MILLTFAEFDRKIDRFYFNDSLQWMEEIYTNCEGEIREKERVREDNKNRQLKQKRKGQQGTVFTKAPKRD
ncbi:MAG: hypothetical protein WBB29_17280 [Geitlerinemataceae cyanobacterium]